MKGCYKLLVDGFEVLFETILDSLSWLSESNSFTSNCRVIFLVFCHSTPLFLLYMFALHLLDKFFFPYSCVYSQHHNFCKPKHGLGLSQLELVSVNGTRFYQISPLLCYVQIAYLVHIGLCTVELKYHHCRGIVWGSLSLQETISLLV